MDIDGAGGPDEKEQIDFEPDPECIIVDDPVLDADVNLVESTFETLWGSINAECQILEKAGKDSATSQYRNLRVGIDSVHGAIVAVHRFTLLALERALSRMVGQKRVCMCIAVCMPFCALPITRSLSHIALAKCLLYKCRNFSVTVEIMVLISMLIGC